jgi:hypothetical protein
MSTKLRILVPVKRVIDYNVGTEPVPACDYSARSIASHEHI